MNWRTIETAIPLGKWADLCTPKHEPLKVGDVITSRHANLYRIVVVDDLYRLIWLKDDTASSLHMCKYTGCKTLTREEAGKLCHESKIDTWFRDDVVVAEIYAPASEPKLEAGMLLKFCDDEYRIVRRAGGDRLWRLDCWRWIFYRMNETGTGNDPESIIGPDWRDWQLLPSEDKREPKWKWTRITKNFKGWMSYGYVIHDSDCFGRFLASAPYEVRYFESRREAALWCEAHAERKEK